ncbi:MAG: hypothetical protein SGJ24_11430 [Chloroflexota bacterium]|nr:hypothetical protein [Chloroflexota bacterium]
MATSNLSRTDYGTSSVREVDTVSAPIAPSRLSRVSWGAILAGLVISLVSMIGLNMLGLAIGASSVNPATEVNPIEPALGTGAAIWILGSNILALFFGGLVAGRLAGIPDNIDGMLHGLVQWAVAFLVTVIFLTTSIGNLVGAVTGAVSTGLSAVGQGLTAISPAVAEAIDLETASLDGVGVEIRSLLNRAAEVATGTEATGTDSTTLAADTAPTLNEIEITRAIGGFLTNADVTDADRQEVITLLSERTGITPEEATATVERWETTITQFRTEAEETAREVGQQAADAIAALAGVVFASMLVAAFASGAGGIIGSPDPRDLLRDTTTASTTTTVR